MKITCYHVLVFVLLFSGIIISAQDNTGIQFELQEDAIIEYGEFRDWDGRHISVGAVVYHDGLFHMFRNGYRGWLLPSGIGYMTSEDGITWEDVQEDPVFTQEQIPFEVDTALLTAALVEADGTWTFYLGLFHQDDPDTPFGIVRATADSPTETWLVDEDYVLLPGSAGTWDERFIAISSVIRSDDEYIMYYASDNGEDYGIGMATSADGINWLKYDDTETTNALYAESDPILVKESDWEVFIQDPRVVQTPDGFVMLYSSFDGNFANQGYSLAISEDGIHWERVSDDAILPRSMFNRNPWYPSLAYHDDTYFIYLEIDSRAGTDIFVATYDRTLTD